jgi:predicted PurR-regulated permease PerM
MRPVRHSSTAALTGIWSIPVMVFVIAILYFGRQILIPLALAMLITFLLAPLVTRLERWLSRIGAVLLVVVVLFTLLASTSWLLTRQVIDLADKLPYYETNIESKLHAFRVPMAAFSAVSRRAWSKLKKSCPPAPRLRMQI